MARRGGGLRDRYGGLRRNAPDALEQDSRQRLDLTTTLAPRPRIKVDLHQAIGTEPHVEPTQISQRLGKQSGTREQDHGERYLYPDEDAAETPRA